MLKIAVSFAKLRAWIGGDLSLRARSREARRQSCQVETLEGRQLLDAGLTTQLHVEALARSRNVSIRSGPSDPLAADSERSLTTPTGWYWYHGVDANFINNQTAQFNTRIVDIEVERTSPLRFSVALVQNSGDYSKGWWWYYGLTASQLNERTQTLGARVLDVESYGTGNQRRFAAVLVPNTGEGATSWWWYYNVSPSFVSSRLTANKARLIDIERESSGNLNVVMIGNTGRNQAGWWYYYNVTPTFVNQKLNQNRARLTDVERQPDGRFTVIMERNQGQGWWWYYGYNEQQLNDLVGRNGARIFDIETYLVNGQKRFAAVMLNNSNELTTRAGEMLRGASNTANVGLYLKEVDGSVLAGLQPDRRFEPASMIKALHHFHALRQVQAGQDALTNNTVYYVNPSDPTNKDVCPDDYAETTQNRVTTTLSDALSRMMMNSDNRTTKAILRRYGTTAINATATNFGLNRTTLGSPRSLGCGVPGNFFTLADAGRLYEAVADGSGLDGTSRDSFYNLMLGGVTGGVQGVVRSEAARKLGRSESDPAVQTLTSQFVASMAQHWKGGSYTLANTATTWREIRTEGGSFTVPFKGFRGLTYTRNYVYGVFVENAIASRSNPNPVRNQINTAMGNTLLELYRSAIRTALTTW